MEAPYLEITIREATEADYEELKEFFDEGAAIHHEGEPGIIGPPSERPMTMQHVARLLASDDETLLVAAPVEAQANPPHLLGFVRLALRDVKDQPGMTPRRYVEIEEVLVRESSRGRGVGQRLMSAAAEWARSQGASEVELTVWEFNRGALSLYERLGFRTINRQMLKRL